MNRVLSLNHLSASLLRLVACSEFPLIKQQQISPLKSGTTSKEKKIADQADGNDANKSVPDSSCLRPDPLNPDDDVCVSLAKTKLHLIGHSYGAKLVTMAGMEAVRRWMLESIAANPQQFSQLASCNQTEQDSSELLKDLAVCDLTGHRKPFGELEIAFSGLQKPLLLKEWFDKTTEIPIDSLVLFNPAFHPSELSYPVDVFNFAPTQTLRFISRKAIVYTTYDYANGALFSLRENILNTQITQIGNQASKKLDQLSYEKNNRWLELPLNLLQSAIAPVDLGYSLVYTHTGLAFYSLANLPWDFWHHVQTGTLGGLYLPPSDSAFGWQSVAKGAANAVDYFLPTNMLYRNESEQGFFRLNKPGLGKTGLNHLAEGRWIGANLWGLEDYYASREPFGEAECIHNKNPTVCQQALSDLKKLKDPPFAPNIGPFTFSRFSTEPFVADMPADFTPGENLWQREKFYSFDARDVFDSHSPLMGAHSDLRKSELPDQENCRNESSDCEDVEKRDHTINFVFNFTQTNFERKFCELNPGEIEAFGVVCANGVSGK
ncbi:MAG: hypothetical protein ACXWAT_12010 [Methylobacter sp.]